MTTQTDNCLTKQRHIKRKQSMCINRRRNKSVRVDMVYGFVYQILYTLQLVLAGVTVSQPQAYQLSKPAILYRLVVSCYLIGQQDWCALLGVSELYPFYNQFFSEFLSCKNADFFKFFSPFYLQHFKPKTDTFSRN